MHNYKELKVWSKAVELATSVYTLCSKFPIEERYGLKSQMQRCAVSIPSNIAEGAGRDSNKSFKYFLSIANGSSYELETQLLISKNIGFIEEESEKAIQSQLTEIMKMIYMLSKSLDK
jgi:four helix bundle protein